MHAGKKRWKKRSPLVKKMEKEKKIEAKRKYGIWHEKQGDSD
jgi:hypothetical protein